MTTPTEAPYGSWKSPITADLIVSRSISLGWPTAAADNLYYLEGRPQEAGRQVIRRRRPDGTTDDVNPAPFNARTRVHEYGGGDFVVAGDDVYFSNFADQRLYRGDPGRTPEPLTNIEGMRYADAIYDAARDRLICVREDHTQPDREAVNTIAAIDLATGAETVLASGHDFYASPRLSPDGTQLAWIGWDHPNMPWDGTYLHLASLDSNGLVATERVVAGSPSESIFQPEWSPDGTVYFVSDANGWWNLYRFSGNQVEPLVQRQAEFGQPMWVFGWSTYQFASANRIVCVYCENGFWKLATIDTTTKAFHPIQTPFTTIFDLTVWQGRAVFSGSSPHQPGSLVSVDLDTGEIETLRMTTDLQIDSRYVSIAEAVEFPTEGGLTAHGFFYAPRNGDFAAPAGELPPLIVMSHGGPTSACSASFSLRIQYWTTRGFAVLDVNYGGSTGYGRAYRERLNDAWGIVDVDDCVNGARYLVERGLVDPNRLAITGGSAGGYTTLSALTFRDVFKAGASHYGIGDLEALARDTHKFESRYLDNLVGPYPEHRDLYVERSPIHHTDRLSTPVIFFQGLEDEVVPPNQAEAMVEALRAKSVPVAYVPFEGEQHGFRQAPHIKRALEGELYFYSRIFGFALAEPVEPLTIENL